MTRQPSNQWVLKSIDSQMTAHGWPLQSLCGLPPAHARSTVVTPYFHCWSVAPRSFGSFAVEGAIGVIHQEFEREWMHDAQHEPRAPGFAAILHASNFSDLREKLYVPTTSDVGAEVEQLCTAVADILGSLPGNEAQLVAAFRKNELAGFPVDSFAGYAYRQKFAAFKRFVSHLRSDTAPPAA